MSCSVIYIACQVEAGVRRFTNLTATPAKPAVQLLQGIGKAAELGPGTGHEVARAVLNSSAHWKYAVPLHQPGVKTSTL